MPAAATGSTLAFKPGSASDTLTVVWAGPDGRRAPLIETPQAYRFPRVSPDGDRVALYVAEDSDGGEREASIWVYTIKTKALDKVTFGQGRYTHPIWTYDGRIVYAGSDDPDGARNLYWTRADGTGAPERLTTSTRDQLPFSITRQGILLYQERNDQGNSDLYSMAVLGDRKPMAFAVTSQFVEAQPAFSPSGQFVAYMSN